MSRYYFDNLLQKYIAGECSPQEEVLVLEWYQHLIERSKVEISEDEKVEIQARIWAKMANNIAVDQPIALKRPVYKLFAFSRIAVAASIILFASFGLYYYWSSARTAQLASQSSLASSGAEITYTNNHQYVEKLTLTDGSKVFLQPNGTLVYPSTFKGNLREVHLTGNAFFEVFRDTARHFQVYTKGLITEVLGTSFHIRQDPPAGEFEIVVVTGKVSVFEQNEKLRKTGDNKQLKNSIILIPNQKATFNASNSQFTTSLVDEPKIIEEYDKNVSGSFVFEDVQLLKVLQELRKAYGIDISTENKDMEKCHFTGDLTKQDLFKKLEIICQSLQSTYEVRGTNIIIKGKGCN